MLDAFVVPVSSAAPSKEIFSPNDTAVLTKDPATFALCHLLVSQSTWNLYELFEAVPEELHGLLERVLDGLARSGSIERSEDRIILSRNYVSVRSPEILEKILPQVMATASASVIRLSREKGDPREPGEAAEFIGIPEDGESVKEVRAATLEYLAKLKMIQAKAMAKPSDEARPTRFVGLVSYQIRLEDFV